MIWLLATLLCILVIEFALRLPLRPVLSEIGSVKRKALHILTARSVSDRWKEKAILAYAGSLLAASIRLAGILLAILAVAGGFVLVSDHFGGALGSFVTSWLGVLYTTAAAILYYAVRSTLV